MLGKALWTTKSLARSDISYDSLHETIRKHGNFRRFWIRYGGRCIITAIKMKNLMFFETRSCFPLDTDEVCYWFESSENTQESAQSQP